MKIYRILKLCLFTIIVTIIAFKIFANIAFSQSMKVGMTTIGLREIRYRIETFKKTTGSYPTTLSQMREYAYSHEGTGIETRAFKEYLSDKDGCCEEYDTLNGNGGWYYDKTTGELKVNLLEPTKYYTKFYFGDHRDEIPAQW